MSAAMIVRQRARRRAEAFRYAHDYLRVARLPNGVPAIVREWVDGLTDDEVQWGPQSHELAFLLREYRPRWTGP